MTLSSSGPAAFLGLQIEVVAVPSSRFLLTLDGRSVEISFAELLQGIEARLPTDGGVRVRRDPSDVLQARLRRPHLIFAPQEPAELDLDFNFYAAAPRTIPTHLTVSLHAARDGSKLFAAQDKIQVTTGSAAEPARRTVKIRTPSSEGAFDLVVRAEPEGMPPLERVIQFVVFDANRRREATSSELTSRIVHEVDPSQPSSDGPWYSTRRLKARTTRLGQFLWSSMRHPFTGPEKSTESPVLLCQLHVEHPGRPHLLQIDYEDAGDQLLAASVSDLDPDRRWVQVPVSTGSRSLPATPQEQSHSFVFWPRTDSPSLSVYVQGSIGLAALKNIRVLELAEPLPALDLPDGDRPNRLFGLCIDHPDTWASWGSARAIDPVTRLPLDDWNTFLDSMNHLTEYARYAGFNCLQPTVVGAGGALYPSDRLAANLRLDNGRAGDRGADPMPKDVVELLFRICGRDRLAVVPNLRLDGAITALERPVHGGDPRHNGLLLVSRDGTVWEKASATSPGSARRYNPLNSAVQAAMLEVVREFVERYASHSVFHDMSFDLASASHAVLPGLDWGYDDQTVAEFARDTGITLAPDGADDPTRFAQRFQHLTSTTRDQWIAWRCRRLATFYESVLAELQRAKPRGRLILALTTLHGPGSDDPRELTRSSRSVEETLRGRGIDLKNWNPPRDLIVLRPFAAVAGSPEGRQLNSSRELDDLLAHLPHRGTLCLHEPEVVQFSTTNLGDRTDAVFSSSIAVPVGVAGRANSRRYAQSIASGDCVAIFDGGMSIPLGQEQSQREFARAFRALPASDFQTFETVQPVIARTSREARETLIYLVNDASYAVSANLAIDCPAQTVLSNAATGAELATKATADGLAAKISLESFQTVLLRAPTPDAVLNACDVVVPQAAESGLKGRFDRLAQAMAVMGRDASRTLEGLPPNGDFEEPATPPGPASRWHAQDAHTSIALDREVTQSGSMSLRVEAAALGTVSSEDFIPPDARALAMNVWLRATHPGQRVRWLLIAERDGQTAHRCYADVVLSTQWEQKQFRARELPESLSGVRVSFQLLDAGTIWIDEARVCALPISQDEKLAISKSFSAIFKAWKDRRLSDFERLTDGYWATYLLESVEASNEPEKATERNPEK